MKLSKRLLSLSLLLALPLASCGGDPSEQPSEGQSEQLEAKITIQDITLIEGEFVDLYSLVTFEPVTSVDTLTFIIVEGGEFVQINANDVLLALAEGAAKVEARGDNIDASTTFNVTVTAAPKPEQTPFELFNIDGTFEGNLDRWVFSGPTASLHQEPEADADRGEEDLQIKLWTGDYVEGLTSSLIDFELSYTFEDKDLIDGTYTLQFDIVGALTEVKATINGTEYSSLNGDIIVNGGGYTTNYIVYEQVGTAFTLKLSFYGADGNVNWGYLDDIKLTAGDVKPVEVAENLIVDGGFEQLGAVGGDFANQSAWVFAGVANANEWGENLKFNSDGARTGSYGLNYWHGSSEADDFTITQTVTIEQAGNYLLSYDITGGDYSIANSEFTSIRVIQNDVELANEFLAPSANYVTVELEPLALEAGVIDIVFRIQTTASNTWIKIDNVSLKAA